MSGKKKQKLTEYKKNIERQKSLNIIMNKNNIFGYDLIWSYTL